MGDHCVWDWVYEYFGFNLRMLIDIFNWIILNIFIPIFQLLWPIIEFFFTIYYWIMYIFWMIVWMIFCFFLFLHDFLWSIWWMIFDILWPIFYWILQVLWFIPYWIMYIWYYVWNIIIPPLDEFCVNFLELLEENLLDPIIENLKAPEW